MIRILDCELQALLMHLQCVRCSRCAKTQKKRSDAHHNELPMRKDTSSNSKSSSSSFSLPCSLVTRSLIPFTVAPNLFRCSSKKKLRIGIPRLGNRIFSRSNDLTFSTLSLGSADACAAAGISWQFFGCCTESIACCMVIIHENTSIPSIRRHTNRLILFPSS
jgi:hypothetical protein